MKRWLILVAMFVFAAPCAFAADPFFFKISAGTTVAPSLSPKIVLKSSSEDSAIELEDFKGDLAGAEGKIAIGIDWLEVGVMWTYYGGKGSDARKISGNDATITYSVTALEATTRLLDKNIKGGFNAEVGYGVGYATIVYDEETYYKKYTLLGREDHFRINLLYEFNENLSVHGSYVNQGITMATGQSHRNSYYALMGNFKF